MGLNWIEHKGKKILNVIYTATSHDENIRLLEESAEIERKNPNLLLLSDYRNTFASPEFSERVKAVGKELRSGPSSVKNAVLGIEGIKKVFANAYLLFTHDTHTKFFLDEGEAKDWLAE